VVYGQREVRQGKSGSSERPRAFFTVYPSDWSRSKFLDTGEFRLFSRRALTRLNATPERDRCIRGMVSWIGFRQVTVRYVRELRAGIARPSSRCDGSGRARRQRAGGKPTWPGKPIRRIAHIGTVFLRGIGDTCESCRPF
jgi:hypothetical protein